MRLHSNPCPCSSLILRHSHLPGTPGLAPRTPPSKPGLGPEAWRYSSSLDLPPGPSQERAESCVRAQLCPASRTTLPQPPPTASVSPPTRPAHPAQLVVGQGAGIHEGLRDDQEHRVHVIGRLHVEHELRVFDDVDPEPQGQAAGRAGEAGGRAAEAGRRARTPGPPGLVPTCWSSRCGQCPGRRCHAAGPARPAGQRST